MCSAPFPLLAIGIFSLLVIVLAIATRMVTDKFPRLAWLVILGLFVLAASASLWEICIFQSAHTAAETYR